MICYHAVQFWFCISWYSNQIIFWVSQTSSQLIYRFNYWDDEKQLCCAVWYHFVAPPCTMYHSKRDTNPVFNATFVDRLCGSWHLPSPSDGWVISRQREVGCTWWGCGFDGHDLDSSTNSVSYSFSNSWFNFVYVLYPFCPTRTNYPPLLTFKRLVANVSQWTQGWLRRADCFYVGRTLC